MKVPYKLLLIIVFFLSVQATATEKLSVSELLDRYAASQDKLRSLTAKTEETITSNWSNKLSPEIMRRISEIRIDDKRIHHSWYRWLNLPTEDAPIPIENAQCHLVLWDGKRYIESNKSMKTGSRKSYISHNEQYIKDDIVSGHYSYPFLGIRYSSYERIDSVLRQAETISIRDELEQVGFVACYVIDAKTKSGTYTVWIDPEHDYNIAKADVRVEPNESYCGRLLRDNESRSLSVRNVRFENVDGVYIPMEADLYRITNKQNGVTVRNAIHHKIAQITLDPNHDVLDSFIPQIEDGTTVHDLDSGIRYTWQEGMKFVVDKWDGSIRYIPKDWSIQVGAGKSLPKFEGIKLNLSAEQIKDREILLCFFDMNQRSSRNCIRQLAQKAATLKEKGVTVAAVQTSQVTEKTLNEWIKKYNIPFSVGAITEDIEKTRFTWGVRSLPWLILTDKQHVVTAEGFTPAELDEKLGSDSNH